MRRQTDTLSCLLEGDEDPGQAPARARELYELAQHLSAGVVLPRHEHKESQHAHLVALAQRREPAPAGLLARLRVSAGERVQRWRHSARLLAATTSATVALSGGGAAFAAERAGPSDLFYRVKLTIDDAQVFLTRDETARGRLQLSQATERIDEADAAAVEGDDAGAARALGEAREVTGEAAASYYDAFRDGDEEALGALAAAQAGQRARLSQLAPLLGTAAQRELDGVVETLDSIDVERGGLLLRAAADRIAEAERLAARGDLAGAQRLLAEAARAVSDATAALGPAAARGDARALRLVTRFEREQAPGLRPLLRATGGRQATAAITAAMAGLPGAASGRPAEAPGPAPPGPPAGPAPPQAPAGPSDPAPAAVDPPGAQAPPTGPPSSPGEEAPTPEAGPTRAAEEPSAPNSDPPQPEATQAPDDSGPATGTDEDPGGGAGSGGGTSGGDGDDSAGADERADGDGGAGGGEGGGDNPNASNDGATNESTGGDGGASASTSSESSGGSGGSGEPGGNPGGGGDEETG